ncbi:Uncharacterised protein [Mycobacteroides abscessus subsp. abscessus]|nr:Uncharacterised protein [Mycobacteroides abscessus subsp. abscessus]SID58334.1 Uncharacterised protein [Mycobacteroides abscessus subsp. abscessus]SIN12262.1 Uncharacterised protein [Mycobacteroides abscessus subsp. abscessus]SKO43677.1 Uncharacterised protein [Mycobacteroides abscessus subsp. abscessus]SLJ20383.1 Uncharacterised protein [Mycobacteroides abscessus subsp. abscessus]
MEFLLYGIVIPALIGLAVPLVLFFGRVVVEDACLIICNHRRYGDGKSSLPVWWCRLTGK